MYKPVFLLRWKTETGDHCWGAPSMDLSTV